MLSACQCAHRRFYGAQALFRRVSNTQRYGHSVDTTSTVRLDHSSAHDHTTKPTRAQTQKVKVSSPRNPLSPNNVDLYLASLDAANIEPTLSDIERYQPPGHSDPNTPQYEQDYNSLRDTLDRSFTKTQLRRFASLYNLPISRSMRKFQLIENIMEKQWRWPSLRDIERMRKDSTEVSTKLFDINPSELFLILGKDGADILHLSTKYNLRISFIPDPLTLKAEGLRGSLKKFTEHIVKLRANIVEDHFKLPTEKPISSDLLQRISRLSGAFIENIDDGGTIRVCVNNPRHLDSAKRLATRAACDIHGPPLLSLYAPQPPSIGAPVQAALHLESYTLYPFLSHRSLPWTMGTSSSFRVRRVGEWLGIESQEASQRSGGLADRKGQFLTISGHTQDLKEILFTDHFLPLGNASTVITASFGHVLLTSSANTQRMSLTPPLDGHLPRSKVLKWLHDHPLKSRFLPSLPYNLLTVTPHRQQYLHRLIYHSLQTSNEAEGTEPSMAGRARKIIKFEIVLPLPKFKSLLQTSTDPSNCAFRRETDDSATSLEPPECGIVHATERSDPHTFEINMDLRSQYWLCSEMIMNVMMPDRPYDVQFCRLNSVECRFGQEPKDLHNYFSDLQRCLKAKNSKSEQPKPPLTLTYSDETYILHTSEKIRRCAIPIHAIASSEELADPSSEVIVEDVLDLESEHKSATCQVIYNENDSEQAWNAFLSSCDRLTTTTSRRQMDDWLSQEHDTGLSSSEDPLSPGKLPAQM